MKDKKTKMLARGILPSVVAVTVLPITVFLVSNYVYQPNRLIELRTFEKTDNGSLTMTVKKYIEIEEGESFNPSDFITAKQGDQKLGIYVNGAEQLDKKGVHTVKVSSTAQDGSFIQKTITVTVKEKKKEPEKADTTQSEDNKKTETAKEEKTEETKQETAKDNTSTKNPTKKPTTKPEVIPVEEKPNQAKPSETKPADKPSETLPVEPEKEAPDKQGSITYYPTGQQPSGTNTSGYYTSMEGCRADHPENECRAYVGADGATVEGYVWIGQ